MLIFDEIVTGFRFDYGGAQVIWNSTRSLFIRQNNWWWFSLAAVCGRSDIMAHFDKEKVGQDGFLMQLGTWW